MFNRLPSFAEITAFGFLGFALQRLLRLAGILGVDVVDHVKQDILGAEV